MRTCSITRWQPQRALPAGVHCRLAQDLTNEEPVNLHGYCPSQGDPGFRTDVAAHLTKTLVAL